MITTVTGSAGPFSFADRGDQLIVRGVLTNVGLTITEAVFSNMVNTKTVNYGVIASLSADYAAINLLGGGIIINAAGGYINGSIHVAGSVSLQNLGAISGPIEVYAAEFSVSDSRIVTRGMINSYQSSTGDAIHLLWGNDVVINTGSIVGNIDLGDGNNVFDGRSGTVVGTVHGGMGDDTYFLTEATSITDAGGIDQVNARMSYTLGDDIENLNLNGYGNFSGTGNVLDNVITGNGSGNQLFGLNGNDTLSGLQGNDILYGGNGDDNLDGGGGNDQLTAGNGNDIISGGSGNDQLFGEVGFDTLLGGAGNDTLYGGSASDTLDGGSGNDVLYGGSFGSDLMTGGDGADIFVFDVPSTSFANNAADVITDFHVGVDKIDFSALVDGALTFVGTSALSKIDDSVRWFQSGGKTVVQVDLNHNGVADMQIFLTGAMILNADCFIL